MRRKIAEHFDGRFAVKVYYDRDWQEYQVRLYVDGKLYEPATYHTDDKQDALDSAPTMLAQFKTYPKFQNKEN